MATTPNRGYPIIDTSPAMGHDPLPQIRDFQVAVDADVQDAYDTIAAGGGGDALTANPLSQFASTTSAQLATVISDETGSGALVFATSPTLVTPILGVASATSINKLTITAPAAGATLTIDDGFTLHVTGNVTALSGSHTGTNTGDNAVNSLYSGLVSNATHTGDATGATALTLATVNSNVGSFGSATQTSQITVNAKGLVTAAANVTITPAVGSITGLGSGVATFLATPSSANLAAAVTGETGSGALVFATSPALVTPDIGVATGASLAIPDTAFAVPMLTLGGTGTYYLSGYGMSLLRTASGSANGLRISSQSLIGSGATVAQTQGLSIFVQGLATGTTCTDSLIEGLSVSAGAFDGPVDTDFIRGIIVNAESHGGNVATQQTTIRALLAFTPGFGGHSPPTVAAANLFRGTAALSNPAVITTLKGIDLSSWTNTGGGTVTTSYGIYMDTSIDVGTTPYAIYSTSVSPSLLSGHLAIGSTSFQPWASAQAALQVGGVSSFMSEKAVGANDSFNLSVNAYFDGAWKYWVTDLAANYYQYQGTHNWRVASSGSANGSITWKTPMKIDSLANVVIGSAAIATSATDGFLYIPTCAGTPTGTPTTYTGRVPLVWDSTNHKLYVYSGGAWKGGTAPGAFS